MISTHNEASPYNVRVHPFVLSSVPNTDLNFRYIEPDVHCSEIAHSSGTWKQSTVEAIPDMQTEKNKGKSVVLLE